MKSLSRSLLAFTVVFFVLQIVAVFINWVSLSYDQNIYSASLWSDKGADIKYIVIALVVLGIVSCIVTLQLTSKEKLMNALILVISAAIGMLGIYYYLLQRSDVAKLTDAGFEIEFKTEIGFYLFITFFAFLVLFQLLSFIVPKDSE